MSTILTVDYNKFIELGGLDLCHYVEPLLSDPTTMISKDTLNRMLSELPTYDDYHLVYALTLGIKYSPETFAMQLPQYLTHEENSVRCTALNSLVQLPHEYVTIALVDLVRELRSLHPKNQWFPDALTVLEKRLKEKSESKP